MSRGVAFGFLRREVAMGNQAMIMHPQWNFIRWGNTENEEIIIAQLSYNWAIIIFSFMIF